MKKKQDTLNKVNKRWLGDFQAFYPAQMNATHKKAVSLYKEQTLEH